MSPEFIEVLTFDSIESIWSSGRLRIVFRERVSVVTRFFVSNVTRRAFLSCDAESFSFRESVCFWALAWFS